MRNKIIVGKIINYIDKIMTYTNGMSYDSFAEKVLIVDACVFNLSQMVKGSISLLFPAYLDLIEYGRN